jgi:hypothetical protein
MRSKAKGEKPMSDYLSVAATARFLQKGENTIRNWERLGKIQALKTETGARIFARIEVERIAQQLNSKTR